MCRRLRREGSHPPNFSLLKIENQYFLLPLNTVRVVETIGEDKNSKDLRDAINDGKKIIITTLQKFPVIFEEINDNKERRFAIIIDEAHSSQTGNRAKKLRTALADTEEALREYAEVKGEDGEDQIVKEWISHGRHRNLSFFSFTATPKQKTLEMFGTRHSDGTFHPFHVYSMRQAIEEGFILDVLKNYMTYQTSYSIAKEHQRTQKYQRQAEVPKTCRIV